MPAPGQWLAVAVLSLSGMAAFGLAPDTVLDTVPTLTIERALPRPALPDADAADTTYWREERVRRGDTIGSLLARAGVDDPEAMQFLRTDPAARPLYRLNPGRPVHVATDADGELVGLRFHTRAGEMLAIERHDGAFRAESAPVAEDVRTVLRSGEIRSSLFGAADAAGIPDAVTVALAEVFAGDIDFYHDVQRGDRFSVVYEMRYVDGEPVGSGRILAAEFENRGVTLRVFLWRDADGEEGYFTEAGRSARGAFLRSPVEFSRITSGFTRARFHPILQKWRAHKGVDYAAPTGTPVRATADGVVTFAGRQGGYGNVIFVRNQRTYSTVYGHLSRFAPQVKAGARVRQGETIGYVGMTGWATGPHLHYEFRIADVARNPLTVALPTAPTIGPDRVDEFKAAILPLADSLVLARSLPGAALAATD
ncbi:MAG: peptidoglycan DD-metalloendopeptidase family protein [Burkholderiales bacterium]|nr:peptidoglycan DD-metalloendopeptidase family protein [Burkholderiales bacterium]